MTKPIISIIVAHADNMAIGKVNRLLWRLPDDLKRFKKLTVSHPIIMGRKTYESIGRPLPERVNIVITRNLEPKILGIISVNSVEEALAKAREVENDEIFIIGGGEIYKQALPIADRLYVTKVETTPEADVFFPEYSHLFTKKVSEEKGEYEGLKYSYLILER